MASFPTIGDDNITGTSGPDTINGLAGNDVIDGQGAGDELDGGEGNDLLYGERGDDMLAGGDVLRAGAGDDSGASLRAGTNFPPRREIGADPRFAGIASREQG